MSEPVFIRFAIMLQNELQNSSRLMKENFSYIHLLIRECQIVCSELGVRRYLRTRISFRMKSRVQIVGQFDTHSMGFAVC